MAKRFVIFEESLQKVNQKYIALPVDEKRRNNALLETLLDDIIEQIKLAEPLFDALYQRTFYGGSFYEKLKVGRPNEYDLDLLFVLPEFLQAEVEKTEYPGYVSLSIKGRKTLVEKSEECWRDLLELFEGNYLCTKKVNDWMQSMVDNMLQKQSQLKVQIDDEEWTVQLKSYRSGPAMCLKIDAAYHDKKTFLMVDLVPCFVFNEDQWPEEPYRKNTSKTRTTFFIVPKSPNSACSQKWRMSFQEQERELMRGKSAMKPTIRLIKKIRSCHEHKIASYFIKTIFLWEAQRQPDAFWRQPLSVLLVTMLEKYAEAIEQGQILYFWNSRFNLIADLDTATIASISSNIRDILGKLKGTCLNKPESIIECILGPKMAPVKSKENEALLRRQKLQETRQEKEEHHEITSLLLKLLEKFENYEKRLDALEMRQNGTIH